MEVHLVNRERRPGTSIFVDILHVLYLERAETCLVHLHRELIHPVYDLLYPTSTMAAHRLGNIVFVSRSALLFFLALLAFIITSIVSIAGRGSATQYEDTYIRPSTSFAKESESHEVINDRTDSPSESQTGSEPSYCETSRKASHGFICEPDQTWAIRKEIFERQEKLQENQRKDPWFTERGKMGRWWQNNYEPTFSCTLEKRIGTQGDGGEIGRWFASLFE